MTAQTEHHARLAPSSAHIWRYCPGSVAMQERQPPEDETDESREGTAAHWLLARTILKLDTPPDAIADNGVPVNQEMRDAIAELVTDINDTIKGCQPGDYYQTEQRVFAHTMIHPDCDGTPDNYFVQFSRKTAHIWDFKYGHRYVDAYRCWQLIAYAAALIETAKIADWRDWSFTLTIAQPRSFSREGDGGTLREWFVSGAELGGYIDELRAAAAKASAPDAPCITGDYCGDCKAAWDCMANLRAGGFSVDVIHGQQGTSMNPASIGVEMRVLRQALDRANSRLKVLETKAMQAIDTGQTVPFHRLEWTKPRWVWDTAKIAEAVSVVQMFGVDVLPGVALPTPNAITKQGVDGSVITPYTTKGAPAKKLVAFEDANVSKILGRR